MIRVLALLLALVAAEPAWHIGDLVGSPEPDVLLLLGFGLVALGFVCRCRKT